MTYKKNSLWQFLASVKLALFVLFLLAASSILGTLIPQGKGPTLYAAFYGSKLAALMADPGELANILTRVTMLLGLDNMYHALWFQTLIGLLAVNLIVCSIDRLPAVWLMVSMDNLSLAQGKISKMPFKREFSGRGNMAETVDLLKESLATAGWRVAARTGEESTILFSQKAPWARLGVYVVHLSILVIIVGAMIGSYLGFSGGVNIPETLDSDKIYLFEDGRPVDLGFTVRCDWFSLSRYPNGAPKEYQSELVVIEEGQEVARKVIEVNDPLTYKGWTFYQSSYEPHNKIMVTVTNKQTGSKERFLTTPKEPMRWQAEGLLFGIKEVLATDTNQVYRYRLLISGPGGQNSLLLDDNSQGQIGTDQKDGYTFHVKEFYSTGLQVSKDPGVWWVYLGCAMMLVGLTIAFFMSHQRIWLIVSDDKFIISGTSHKNKIGFENKFNKLTGKLSKQFEAL
ncbi:MAG: cytochrome c biogenesis protein ResB [Thermodesulfobacteriota bacterium]